MFLNPKAVRALARHMANETFQALKFCFPLDVNDVASDCGWLPVVQLFSRRGMQMALIGAYLAWMVGPFLIPHEYLGNLVSSWAVATLDAVEKEVQD